MSDSGVRTRQALRSGMPPERLREASLTAFGLSTVRVSQVDAVAEA